MMSSQNIEIIASPADRVKLVLAGVLVVAGIVGWYALARQPLALRWGAMLAGVLVGLGVAWTSLAGRRLVAFGRESWAETRRVVWPARKEAWMVTLYVFGFVLVMALFLWVVDKSLEWVLYDLILGWKR
jgi:preprotein translocase subunit SecE